MKQFFSGIFITIVMTGLDQDMMQKNLSCKSLKDAQKNMYTYGFAFTPVNFLFLSLGVLLLTLASQQQIELPALNDDILPMFCTSGILGHSILIFFTIGIIAAAFSSADSALTALTTSFCIDILGVEKEKAQGHQPDGFHRGQQRKHRQEDKAGNENDFPASETPGDQPGERHGKQ
jgi:Na+/proline symporter